MRARITPQYEQYEQAPEVSPTRANLSRALRSCAMVGRTGEAAAWEGEQEGKRTQLFSAGYEYGQEDGPGPHYEAPALEGWEKTPDRRTIVFVRHGETDWNRQKRYLGRTDVPLNAGGREQAEALARRLASVRFDAVYASPLTRAAETARIVCRSLNCPYPVVLDSRLAEIDFGLIEGLTYGEAHLLYPSELACWYDNYETVPPPGGGESQEQVGRRTASFVGGLARSAHARVLVVSHGGPIRSWIARRENKRFWDVEVRHTEPYEYELTEEAER